jgi:ubiquinol-cytochrome c reductase cytochrome b subunit
MANDATTAPAPNGWARKALQWVDDRFPLTALWNSQVAEYYAPKNMNVWYFFGSLALLVLVNQIVTGIFLTMNYKPDANLAFASVEYIMREVSYGWLIRYMHSTGASAFFIVVYLHMFRALLYGSFRKPRELTWIFGVLIFLSLMGEAFFGYLLPWGQMSYWGAQVIVNLFGAIPVIGEDLSTWIRGDYVVSDATLNRFFAMHVIALPLVLLGLVVAHLIALHETGSNNPDGVEIKKVIDPKTGHPVDGIPFHPYYTVKDLFGAMVFLFVFSVILFFAPEMGGYFLEHNNFIPADPLKTPPHIAPVWYFTPYYSILRATTTPFLYVLSVGVVLLVALYWRDFKGIWRMIVPAAAAVVIAGFLLLDAKVWGVVFMGVSVLIFFALPWLDHSPVKSIRYKGPIYKVALAIFAVAFVILGYLGVQVPTDALTRIAQFCTLLYFGFFLLMPWYSRLDSHKPVPERVTYHAH